MKGTPVSEELSQPTPAVAMAEAEAAVLANLERNECYRS